MRHDCKKLDEKNEDLKLTGIVKNLALKYLYLYFYLLTLYLLFEAKDKHIITI